MLIAIVDKLPFVYIDGNFFQCRITETSFERGGVDVSKKGSKIDCLYSVQEIRHYFLKVEGLQELNSIITTSTATDIKEVLKGTERATTKKKNKATE